MKSGLLRLQIHKPPRRYHSFNSSTWLSCQIPLNFCYQSLGEALDDQVLVDGQECLELTPKINLSGSDNIQNLRFQFLILQKCFLKGHSAAQNKIKIIKIPRFTTAKASLDFFSNKDFFFQMNQRIRQHQIRLNKRRGTNAFFAATQRNLYLDTAFVLICIKLEYRQISSGRLF